MSEEQIKGWFKYERKKEKKNGKNKIMEFKIIKDLSKSNLGQKTREINFTENDDFSGYSVDNNTNNSMILKPILETPNSTRGTISGGSERKRKFSEEDSMSSSIIGTKKLNPNTVSQNLEIIAFSRFFFKLSIFRNFSENSIFS